uniref:PhoLip_ATPase_C domain-containing protein n=1 Tax=Macrostomum lignano TaxID=282301 RepID=A0A1I8FQQ6_9PLAT
PLLEIRQFQALFFLFLGGGGGCCCFWISGASGIAGSDGADLLDRELRAAARRVEAGQVRAGPDRSGLEAAVAQDSACLLEIACRASGPLLLAGVRQRRRRPLSGCCSAHTGRRCAAIGDGGNDVAMIQAADCGLGIAGREGATGRSSSRRERVEIRAVSPPAAGARPSVLSQFGPASPVCNPSRLAISAMQAVFFSGVLLWPPVSLFPALSWSAMATVFTISSPYSRWCWIGTCRLPLRGEVSRAVSRIAQGAASSQPRPCGFGRAVSLYSRRSHHVTALCGYLETSFLRIVSIAFTAIVLNELLMVACTVRTWHWLMSVAELLKSALLPAGYPGFILTLSFLWKVSVITAISAIPFFVIKFCAGADSPAWFEQAGRGCGGLSRPGLSCPPWWTSAAAAVHGSPAPPTRCYRYCKNNAVPAKSRFCRGVPDPQRFESTIWARRRPEWTTSAPVAVHMISDEMAYEQLSAEALEAAPYRAANKYLVKRSCGKDSFHLRVRAAPVPRVTRPHQQDVVLRRRRSPSRLAMHARRLRQAERPRCPGVNIGQ